MRDPWVSNTEFKLPARYNTLIINLNNIIYTNELLLSQLIEIQYNYKF